MEGHSGIERERERDRARERERERRRGAIETDTDGEGEITIINICKGPDAHLRKAVTHEIRYSSFWGCFGSWVRDSDAPLITQHR